MGLDPAALQTRRSLLAGGVGALAVGVASELARPGRVLAQDEPIVVGGTYADATSPTSITNSANGSDVLSATSTTGSAVVGTSASGDGVRGTSATGPAVHGLTTYAQGVLGEATDGTGVGGNSVGIGVGVIGSSGRAHLLADVVRTGVCGYANQTVDAMGVWGMSNIGVGVSGTSASGDGVRGTSVTGTAVHGAATTTSGVLGEATTGNGVYAKATTGTALRVEGKIRCNAASAGRVAILKGKASAKVTLTGVTTTSQVFAALRTYRSGVYIAAVVPTSGYFTVYLNKALGTTTYCSYFIVN